MLERREGGRGSAAGVLALLPLARRAGVLGMPGRCSQEKGTAEARSGERKRWWNGEGAGEKGGAEEDEDEEEAPEADVRTAAAEKEEDDDDEEEDGDGRRCRRRRRVAAPGTGTGDAAGLGIAAAVGQSAGVSGVGAGAGREQRWAFYGWVWVGSRRGDVIRMCTLGFHLGSNFLYPRPRHRIKAVTVILLPLLGLLA